MVSIITVIALTLLTPDAERTEFSSKERDHWAFQSIASPVGESIDDFILQSLNAAKLAPAKPATKRELIRRVTFDLTGLPPTIEEIDAFLADVSPTAWETVVDRLLASHYGERWGRHWLDVARYADSNGLDENTAFSNAWKYRDYVVNSFNSDKPYDQFLREQIAGDLMPTTDPTQRLERLTATGYLAIGPKFLAEVDKQKLRLDIADEQLDTLGRGVMALTLGCAKCHDHKFDPIPTIDYYSLLAIFTSTQTMQTLNTVAKAYEYPEGVLGVKEGSVEAYGTQPQNLHVQIRGDYTNPGDEAPARFLQILPSDNVLSVVTTSPNPNHATKPNTIRNGPLRASSGRLELAQWLTNPKHPLTARVIVNRIWAGHFGQGLVRSTNNFGMNGERPTHPELLDWLATKFVQEGWSIKKMHKRILLSTTYRMGGSFDKQSATIDPEDRLLWRFPRRRLDAEMIRDSLLSVGGNLDSTVGGSIWSPKNFEYVRNVDFNSTRRSLYLPVIRGEGFAFFDAFDFPDASAIADTRKETVVPTQSLYLMNNPFVDQQALAFAQRLQLAEPTREGRIRLAYKLVYGRDVTDVEVKRASAFIDNYLSVDPERPADEGNAWQTFCQALFASNEFLYVE